MVIHFYISLVLLHWSPLPIAQTSHTDDPSTEKTQSLNEQTLGILSRLDDNEGKALALHSLAWLYYTQDNWDSTLIYGNQALVLEIKINDIEGIAANRHLLGMVHFQKKEFGEALEQFHIGLHDASKAKVAPIMVKLYREIAQTHFEKQEYAEALENLEKHKELNDSLFNISNITQINSAQAIHDVQLRQEKLKQLQAQKELDEISLSFHRTFTYLLFASALIV